MKNMKNFKIIMISAVLSVTAIGLTGCGGGGAKHIDINLENPITECSSIDEMNSIAGTDIIGLGAMGVADESYRVINVYDDVDTSMVDYVIAEYEFSANGDVYTLRSSLEADADISGVYIDEAPAYDAKATENIEYKNSNNVMVARWSTDDNQFVLMKLYENEITAEDEVAFRNMAEELSL